VYFIVECFRSGSIILERILERISDVTALCDNHTVIYEIGFDFRSFAYLRRWIVFFCCFQRIHLCVCLRNKAMCRSNMLPT